MPVDVEGFPRDYFGWEKQEWEGVHSIILATWRFAPWALLHSYPALFCTAKGRDLKMVVSGLLSVSFQLSLASGSHGGGLWGCRQGQSLGSHHGQDLWGYQCLLSTTPASLDSFTLVSASHSCWNWWCCLPALHLQPRAGSDSLLLPTCRLPHQSVPGFLALPSQCDQHPAFKSLSLWTILEQFLFSSLSLDWDDLVNNPYKVSVYVVYVRVHDCVSMQNTVKVLGG